jgi:hypothetical protein
MVTLSEPGSGMLENTRWSLRSAWSASHSSTDHIVLKTALSYDNVECNLHHRTVKSLYRMIQKSHLF